MSIESHLHVSLSAYDDLVDDTYTVKRTSGLFDDGWKISHQSASQPSLNGPSATKHCGKDDNKWRIFLDNNKSGEAYACGWRRIETIHPTRLYGGDIEAWRESTIKRLDELEILRIKNMLATIYLNEH